MIVLLVIAAASSRLTGDAVRDIVSRADPARLVVAVVSMTTGLVFLALRWRAMMPDARGVGVGALTSIFTMGTLLHYALPGPVGEVVTAAMAARRFGGSTEAWLAGGLHARFIGLAAAGIVSGALFATQEMPVPPGLERWIGLATFAIAAGAVGLGALSAFPDTLRRVARLVLAPSWLARPRASAERLTDGLAAVGRLGPERYLRGVIWALCGHACVTLGIWMAARGLGAAPNPAGLAFTYTMTTAGAVVLFAFPGAQVGWDAMFASLLATTAGLSLTDAVAIAAVVRGQQLLTVLLGAALLLRQVPSREDEAGSLIR